MLHLQDVTGARVRATDGELGRIDDVLFDERDWKVRYLVIDSGRWLKSQRVLVAPAALDRLDPGARSAQVRLSREEVGQCRSAPAAPAHEPLLSDYYGVNAYWWGGRYPAGWGLAPARRPTLAAAPVTRAATPLRSYVELKGCRLDAAGAAVGRVEDLEVDEDSWTVRALDLAASSRGGEPLRVSPADVTAIHGERGTVEARPPPGPVTTPGAGALRAEALERALPKTRTVADFLVRRLAEWGVRRIYGYPGDGINGIMGALDRAQGAVQFVQARHEELAAFMACAHAKFTGEVGVCLATSGPGAIHLLNGLYDAKLDHQPVVAIVGQQQRAALGGDYLQEVDLHALFKDVAHEYVQTAMVPAQVRHLVDRALRIARERRTVTCLIFPHDVQELDAVVQPPRAHGTVHSGIGLTGAVAAPDAALQRAAAILNEGQRVAILAGAGALHATDELVEVAERLGAGVAKALLGKAALPDDLSFVTGCIGLLGTEPSWRLMSGCDTLLMVGSGFPYSEFLPPEGQARGVQIDIDGRMLNLRYPMEVGLLGDSQATLRALLPHLKQKEDRAWQRKIEADVARWWQVLEKRAMNAARPINPQRVFWELSPRLPERCILTCDSGSAANWYARDLKIRRGMMASLSGGLATMGPAVPYAIAAKYAHPDRHVIALVGDGSMQMNGLNGLITIAKVWREWAAAGNGRLTVMVLNNGDLNQVTWEQRVLAGDRKFEASQVLPDFPYAQYAELLGLRGERVERADAVAPAWDRALASEVPTVLEMVTDPDVPPLPPHITAKQAKAYLSALLKGDADSIGIVKASAREWWDGLATSRR